MAMMTVSSMAFLLLDNLRHFNSERVDERNKLSRQNSIKDAKFRGEEEEYSNSSNSLGAVESQASSTRSVIQGAFVDEESDGKAKLFLLLALQTFVCFISNGAFPSIQVNLWL